MPSVKRAPQAKARKSKSVPVRRRGTVPVIPERKLGELYSVGPATIADLALLGIDSVSQLATRDATQLYEELCDRTGAIHDPCCEDVFAAAIAQARDPNLQGEKTKWWYWSRLRKQGR